MKLAVIGVLAVGITASAYAHHSNDYHFDRSWSVTVTGTVKAFRFINPNAELAVDVLGAGGAARARRILIGLLYQRCWKAPLYSECHGAAILNRPPVPSHLRSLPPGLPHPVTTRPPDPVNYS